MLDIRVGGLGRPAFFRQVNDDSSDIASGARIDAFACSLKFLVVLAHTPFWPLQASLRHAPKMIMNRPSLTLEFKSRRPLHSSE